MLGQSTISNWPTRSASLIAANTRSTGSRGGGVEDAGEPAEELVPVDDDAGRDDGVDDGPADADGDDDPDDDTDGDCGRRSGPPPDEQAVAASRVAVNATRMRERTPSSFTTAPPAARTPGFHPVR